MEEFINKIINGILSNVCEVWKISTLYPKCEVSNLGNVRDTETKTLCDLTPNRTGYYYVSGAINRVNIMVATEFCRMMTLPITLWLLMMITIKKIIEQQI